MPAERDVVEAQGRIGELGRDLVVVDVVSGLALLELYLSPLSLIAILWIDSFSDLSSGLFWCFYFQLNQIDLFRIVCAQAHICGGLDVFGWTANLSDGPKSMFLAFFIYDLQAVIVQGNRVLTQDEAIMTKLRATIWSPIVDAHRRIQNYQPRLLLDRVCIIQLRYIRIAIVAV